MAFTGQSLHAWFDPLRPKGEEMLLDLLDLLDGMSRERNQVSLLPESLSHVLGNPIFGIGRKTTSFLFIEASDRFQQAQIAFLDQFREGDSVSLEIQSHADDQAQIGFHQPTLGLQIGLCSLSEQHGFFVFGKQGKRLEILEVASRRSIQVNAKRSSDLRGKKPIKKVCVGRHSISFPRCGRAKERARKRPARTVSQDRLHTLGRWKLDYLASP